jgi:Mg2+ and Co2+ transporter CorA
VHLSEPYFVVIVVVLVLLLLLWWGRTRSVRREKAALASRTSDTLDTFVESFRPEVRTIARAVYSEFQNYTNTGHFPFRKSDKVAQILRLDPSEDDALTQIARQFGCRKPSKEDDSKFRGRETLEDFVEFIHYLRVASPI